jgi:hypothetical protein
MRDVRESKEEGLDMVRQGKARKGKVRQGKARQGKARQGKARQGKARQGKARQTLQVTHLSSIVSDSFISIIF